MIKPDYELIAEVMLFSQGFEQGESLAGKIVLLFQLCQDQLSSQPHYDFGLRAVKSVLVSAGHLKRKLLLGDGGGGTAADGTPVKAKGGAEPTGASDALRKQAASNAAGGDAAAERGVLIRPVDFPQSTFDASAQSF